MADIAAAPVGTVLPQPAAAGLRVVEEADAKFANRLHALVAAAPTMILRRGLHQRDAEGGGGPIFADPRGFCWQPLDVQSGDAADLDGQMAVLARHEPMLAAIEQAIGVTFSPETVEADWQEGTRWIELAVEDQICAFGFATEWQDASRLPLASGDATITASVPLRAALAVRAALLPLGQAETLGAGDLLCLPAGAVSAMLTMAQDPNGHHAIECTFTLREGLLAPGHNPERTRMSLSTEEGGAERFKVPLTVRLPELAIAADEIAALAEGGTIRLRPLVEGLEVDLLVAGQPVASGEIVRLGEDFAVLIDRVVGRQGGTPPSASPMPLPIPERGAE